MTLNKNYIWAICQYVQTLYIILSGFFETKAQTKTQYRQNNSVFFFSSFLTILVLYDSFIFHLSPFCLTMYMYTLSIWYDAPSGSRRLTVRLFLMHSCRYNAQHLLEPAIIPFRNSILFLSRMHCISLTNTKKIEQF